MRITSSSAFDASIGNLQGRQQALAEAQNRLTSGKRVLTASDDPVAAARAERALASMVRSAADQRALDASRNVTLQTEAALGDATDMVQQAREVIVNAGNGSFSDSDRLTLANSLKGIRDQLLAVANRKRRCRHLPVRRPGHADAALRRRARRRDLPGHRAGRPRRRRATSLPLTMDGERTWLQTPNPTSGGAALSVFSVLDSVINELKTPGRTGAQVKQTVTTGAEQHRRGGGHADLGARRGRRPC